MPHTACTVLPALLTITSVPLFVTVLCRGMPGMWKSRHRLLLCWLVCMPALDPGRTTLAARARWTPAQGTVWRLRRLLKARYWHVHLLVEWWAQAALATLPPPRDGPLSLGGDGSEQAKRGTQTSLAPKGRKRAHPLWFFGIRFALLLGNWDS